MKAPKLFRGIGVAMIAGMLSAAVLVAPAQAGGSATTSKETIYKIAATSDDFSTLTTAVKAAGLKKALSGKDALTVFAPTDEAFAKIPSATLTSLLADKDALASLLTYHVLEGKVPAAKLMPTQSVTSLSGEDFTINVADGAATIVDGAGNTIAIVTTDIKAKNGVIHVIDAVMSPQASS